VTPEPAAVAASGLGGSERQCRLALLAIGACVALVLGTAIADSYSTTTLAAVTFVLVVIAWERQLLAWPTMTGYVIAVLLFIPIRRFTIGGGLPFTLEPYRLLVILVLAAWLLAVLADPRARWRKTGLEGPIVAFTVVAIASIMLNLAWIAHTGITGAVGKQVSIFASFLLVMVFVSSTITTRRQLDGLIKLLVLGGTVVAVMTFYEWRSGQNLFNNMDRYIPVLRLDSARELTTDMRGGHVRAYASAEHPIALGAMLVLLLPLAVYLYRRASQPLWLLCAALLTFGSLASGSRTAAVMLATLLVTFFFMKRKETVRLLPMLLPLFVACQVVMPGTLTTFKSILFPQGGSVIQEQEGGAGAGEGRVADLGPTLAQWSHKPFLGQGLGTRLSGQADWRDNARILDDQWLGSLLEIGAFGVLALLWLFVRAVRMLARRAKRDATPYGWLLAALGASLVAYAVGMVTYDAFSFIQVTFLTFILLGLAGAACRIADEATP
jgi:hypothetical protein